jgi:L-fucose isomerase-like protein
LTVGCCESPFLDLEMEHKTTPCLATSLLNERGLPASCQGDLSALLTVAAMIYLSRKSVFMGNLGAGGDGGDADGAISISHSAPGLRMDGLNAPRLPYGLHPFGVMEWGTALHVDLLQAKDTYATVARFDPLAERLLVTTGEIVQSVTVEDFCKQMVQIRVPDAAGFLRRAHTDYGGHFTVVCGDYVRQLEDLGEMLGFQVELL